MYIIEMRRYGYRSSICMIRYYNQIIQTIINVVKNRIIDTNNM